MSKAEIRRFTSWLGKRSYKSRLERLGLERLQEIARENGKLGGRPRKEVEPLTCPHCDGCGRDPGYFGLSKTRCHWCKGTGQVQDMG